MVLSDAMNGVPQGGEGGRPRQQKAIEPEEGGRGRMKGHGHGHQHEACKRIEPCQWGEALETDDAHGCDTE